MKHLSLFFSLLFISSFGFTQQIEKDKEGYVEIPALSEAINVEGGAIKIENLVFKYLPEYAYTDGVVFGSWIKMEANGIETVNNFNGMSFVLSTVKLTCTDNGRVVLKDDWSYGKGVALESDEVLKHIDYIKIGEPYYSGNYVWEVGLANMCNDKVVTVSVPFKIIPNPCVTTTLKGAAKISEAYLWNGTEKYIYANDKIFPGLLEFTLADISGFTVKDGIVKTGVELKLMDESGEVLMASADVATGENAFSEVKDGLFTLTPNVTLGTKYIEQKLTFQARIWDKYNNENQITAIARFTVRK
jgi:hypothetical protein